MQIYVQHQGQQTGPFSLDQVRAGLANGIYQPSDLAWYEGAPAWLSLSRVPGVMTSPPPGLPGAGFQPTGVARNSTLAIWSMILGILSFLLAGLTAIPAVICGHLALGRIKKSSGALGGGGMAVAGLVTGYLGLAIFMIAVVAGLAAPLIIRQRKKADQTEAINNLRQVGIALFEFEEEYGKYPDASTATLVAKDKRNGPVTGTSSNACFRQLFRADIMSSEMPFYAHIPQCRKPDNQMDGNHALEAGECGFAYISNSPVKGNLRPVAMTPFVQGTTRFDPLPFDGKALVLWSDNSVKSMTIDRRSGEVMLDGRNLLDPAHPVWGGTPPVIAFPE